VTPTSMYLWLVMFLSLPGDRLGDGTCSVTAASSTGRCNTFQCIDSTMLPQEKQSVWL